MKKGKQTDSTNYTWRDLQSKSGAGGTSFQLKKRRLQMWFRGAVGSLLLLTIITGLVGLYYLKRDADQSLRATKTAVDYPQLNFDSDGVLTTDWAKSYFWEWLARDVRSIDLNAVKLHAEAFGQIKEANVQRRLPNELRISIQEREPILRVRVKGEQDRPKTLLIARDGTVFEGRYYPENTIRRLPGAVGLTLLKDGDNWLPIEGIVQVADFLDEARFQVPSLYRQWRLIDLTQWSKGMEVNSDLIEVRQGKDQNIVFSVNGFQQQLTRLAQIVTHTQRYQMGFPARIDLSFGREAVIDFNR